MVLIRLCGPLFLARSRSFLSFRVLGMCSFSFVSSFCRVMQNGMLGLVCQVRILCKKAFPHLLGPSAPKITVRLQKHARVPFHVAFWARQMGLSAILAPDVSRSGVYVGEILPIEVVSTAALGFCAPALAGLVEFSQNLLVLCHTVASKWWGSLFPATGGHRRYVSCKFCLIFQSWGHSHIYSRKEL